MSLEASQAELEALERAPMPPRKKKLTRCVRKRSGKNPPRDELGRFTRLRKKGAKA